jgi:hypothetical protein
MPITTTAGGENAVFIDNVDQLEPGETEDACVAFSAANVFYSTQPGTPNHYTAEQVDQLADKWYTRDTGSITSSQGLSEKQLQDMLSGMGLAWETIPITNNGSTNDEAVRSALRAGKLVLVCAAEDSFFDLEIGRPPYSWNTKPFNHCIVASGLITSGPWAGNVWVRDTVAVSGGYPPSTKRPYDIGKMQYVSLTAVVPSWLKGETSMSNIPQGWTDNGSILTAPNGVTVAHGFRDYILSNTWDADDIPLRVEYQVSSVLLHNTAVGPGARLLCKKSYLWYTIGTGVRKEPYTPWELDSAYNVIATQQAEISALKAQPAPAPMPNVLDALSHVEAALAAAGVVATELQKVLPDLKQ